MRFAVPLLIIMLIPLPALAHKVIVFAYPEGEVIVAEGSFPGGRPCKECPMSLEDTATGEVLLEGAGDKAGIWHFELPADAAGATDGLSVVLDGGEGHRAEWRLEPDEYLSLLDGAPAAVKAPSPPQEQEPPSAAVGSESMPAPSGMTPKEFEQAVARAVAEAVSRELAPLKRQMLKDDGPDLRDVLGGIGYILGLAGLMAWARSRKQ